MSFGLIGRKVGMTQMFAQDGLRTAVTVVEIGPCVILQKKTMEHDGYNALQLGFLPKKVQWSSKAQDKEGQGKVKGTRKRNSVTKAMFGHCKAAGKGVFRYIREFRFENVDGFEVGQEITLEQFAEGERIAVCGISKGRGFQGVIKRYKFIRGNMTHGSSKCHRRPGSIGMCATPGRVLRGKKMPGHMGAEKTTVRNLKIMSVDRENNLLFIRGAVPGHSDGMVSVLKLK